jgi:hypothetical protein
VARPEQVDVWIGLDVGKEDHFAVVLDDAGERIFGRSVANDEAALEALVDRAGQHGTAGRTRITKVIKTRSPRLAVTVTGAVMAALGAQSVTVPAEAATGRVIAELATELDRVYARRDALAGEIEEVFLARRPGPGHPPVGQVDQRRVPEPQGQPSAEERHVPGRVRRPARPGVQSVL